MTAPADVCVVVGGSTGIGAAVAAAQRAAGHQVVVWDRAGEPDIRCDVADPAQVEAAAVATGRRFGAPTFVTVCAGVGHSGSLLGTEPDDWDRVMNINARGTWLALRALAATMISAGATGSLVATSSVSARLADPTMGVYCASKAAVSMLVRVAAAEWAPLGLRVNAVAPGVTQTPMLGGAPPRGDWLSGVSERTPLGRLGTAEDIAEAVLALHTASWVTGQILEADGGLGLHSPILAWLPAAER